MIIWILMILDLFVLGAISLVQFNIAIPAIVLFYSAGYMGLKALLFRDVMSMLDLVIGVYILIVAIFGFTSFFYYIALAWISYKLVFTLFGSV
ncbi:MAG: hypothetical protein ABIH49_00950 [archaeon]